MRLITFLKKILKHLLNGQLDVCIYLITKELPYWLIVYNKAYILRTNSFSLPDNKTQKAEVKIATSDDLDDIVRISGWTEKNARKLFQSGLKFFLGSLPGRRPSALTCLANGSCYIRGMGFRHTFMEHEIYGMGTVILPEDRRKGLYIDLNKCVIEDIKKNNIQWCFVLIEFCNERSLYLRRKMGFKDFMTLTFLKIGCLKISRTREISTGKKSLRIFFREPGEDLTII